MLSKIRKRATYANVAMTFAFVFAMTGGAFAAKKYVINSTKQINPKVLKQLEGKTGAPGAKGAQGVQGVPGLTGANGKDGAPGTNGTNGNDGTSVTSVTLPTGNATCKEGGSEFIAAASKKTFACTGAPWPAGGTLPKGQSEKGFFSILYQATATGDPGASAISLTIPLDAAPEAHYIGTKEELAGEANEAASIKEGKCKGNREEPEAASGNICVFAAAETNATDYLLLKLLAERVTSGTPFGAAVVAASEGAGEVLEVGTWVATD